MKVEIAPAAESDAEALVEIQKAAFRRLYDIYRDEGSPYLRGADEMRIMLERPNWHVYKIAADGALVGGIAVRETLDNPGDFYLGRIYILPEMQGRGIAPAAIALCEAEFPNARHWTLDFPEKEQANRRCYEKAGYTDTGERQVQSGGAIRLAVYEKLVRG